MTALSNDKQYQRRDGDVVGYPVEAGKIIYLGALVGLNAARYAEPAADAAGMRFAGVATHSRCDNSAGADGDATVVVYRRGLHRLAIATAVTQADVGKNVYAVDDQTVDLAAATTNDVWIGTIVKVESAAVVWVDIEPAVQQA